MIFYDESSPFDEGTYERLVDAVHRGECEIFVQMCENMIHEIVNRGKKSED